MQTDFVSDVNDLARLYGHAELDPVTDQRPLSIADRTTLLDLFERYERLREHPAMPYQDVSPQMVVASTKLGISVLRCRGRCFEPGDVLRALREIKGRLHPDHQAFPVFAAGVKSVVSIREGGCWPGRLLCWTATTYASC